MSSGGASGGSSPRPTIPSPRPPRVPAAEIIQINGRKVLGPPANWEGPPPSNLCELFVRKIPRYLTEDDILPHLLRFGEIYEFRLMMEFNYANRGYAFVRYAQEVDARRALEVLNHFYIVPGRTLEVQRSFDKCRLFIGNIPKRLSEEELEESFKAVFPSMCKLITLKRISDGENNRGFAFIDFRSHEDAVEVKKQVSPGTIKMWGQDLRVAWANPERPAEWEAVSKTKTLFVRNVGLDITPKMFYEILTPIVKRTDIMKVSRVREFAFIDFVTRTAAEHALERLQGTKMQGYTLHFEWAFPPSMSSENKLQSCDFDAVLRLKCIANYWEVPVIIFGRIFEVEQLQYAAIIVRTVSQVRAFFFEVHINPSTDIQSRMCEVAALLIDRFGGLPPYNFVIVIKDSKALIVGMFGDFANRTFIKAEPIERNMFVYCEELLDLCQAVFVLSLMTQEELYSSYQLALTTPHGVLASAPFFNGRMFACLNANYRHRPPLKYNIDNRQIILVLCSLYTGSNFVFPNIQPIVWNLKDSGNAKIGIANVPFSILNLVPNRYASVGERNCVSVVRHGKIYDWVICSAAAQKLEGPCIE